MTGNGSPRWHDPSGNYERFAKYINPQLVRVLKTIGFDKTYVRGEGPYLFDEQGAKYLDFISGHGVFNIGRNHPRVKAALKEVIDADLANMIQLGVTPLAGRLAEELTRRSPGEIENVFFTNSGTEAVEAALKFARAYTGRARVVYCGHAFHGLTLGSLSVNGGKEFRERFEPLLPGFSEIPFNDAAALEKELRKKEVAAFIVEPVQGKGLNVATREFLQEARRLCTKYGTVLICDEVQSGLGRTGTFYAFEHSAIVPDIITIAKGLSGGFVPVGAALMRRPICEALYDRMDRCVVHSNTFGKNNLAMAAGLATLEILDDEKLLPRAPLLEKRFRAKLEPLSEKYEMFRGVKGKGMMLGLEFGAPRSLKLKAGWSLIHAASGGLFGQMIVVPLLAEHKILSQVAGHNMDIVKLLPPLVTEEADVDYFADAFEKVVAACHTFPGAAWEIGMKLAKGALASRSKNSTAVEENLHAAPGVVRGAT